MRAASVACLHVHQHGHELLHSDIATGSVPHTLPWLCALLGAGSTRAPQRWTTLRTCPLPAAPSARVWKPRPHASPRAAAAIRVQRRLLFAALHSTAAPCACLDWLSCCDSWAAAARSLHTRACASSAAPWTVRSCSCTLVSRSAVHEACAAASCACCLTDCSLHSSAAMVCCAWVCKFLCVACALLCCHGRGLQLRTAGVQLCVLACSLLSAALGCLCWSVQLGSCHQLPSLSPRLLQLRAHTG